MVIKLEADIFSGSGETWAHRLHVKTVSGVNQIQIIQEPDPETTSFEDHTKIKIPHTTFGEHPIGTFYEEDDCLTYQHTAQQPGFARFYSKDQRDTRMYVSSVGNPPRRIEDKEGYLMELYGMDRRPACLLLIHQNNSGMSEAQNMMQIRLQSILERSKETHYPEVFYRAVSKTLEPTQKRLAEARERKNSGWRRWLPRRNR